MKELLHSKEFKKNIIKWLFMYCCVMFILTIVVTYSRYITSTSGMDGAKTAKFNVNVKYDECSSIPVKDSEVCFDNTMSESRPSDKVSFYYTIDTTNLEVKTKLVTIVNINNPSKGDIKYFSNFKLYKIINGNEIEVETTKSTDSITATEDIDLGQGKKEQYKLVMDYAYEEVGYSNPITLGNNSDFISVNYSATQID